MSVNLLSFFILTVVGQSRPIYFDQWLNMPLASLPSERLCRVRTILGDPANHYFRLAVARTSGLRLLENIADLRGRVRIRSAAESLRFVRLRTAPPTWNAWPGNTKLVEIFRANRLNALPNFGLSSGRFRFKKSGDLGLLTDVSWNRFGFREPQVSRVTNGFRISRWLLRKEYGSAEINSEKYTVMLVQELVGLDGGYSMRISEIVRGDSYPCVKWNIPIYF